MQIEGLRVEFVEGEAVEVVTSPGRFFAADIAEARKKMRSIWKDESGFIWGMLDSALSSAFGKGLVREDSDRSTVGFEVGGQNWAPFRPERRWLQCRYCRQTATGAIEIELSPSH